MILHPHLPPDPSPIIGNGHQEDIAGNTYESRISQQEVKVKVKVIQSCPTLCDPLDYTVQGILQARILEWVPVPFSMGSSNPEIEPRSLALQADSSPAGELSQYLNSGRL